LEDLQRRSVLRKILGYGHWDLLQNHDFHVIARDEFIFSLRQDHLPELWLQKTLDEERYQNCKIAVLNASVMERSYQHLFFSEPDVFQRYIEKGQVPLLSLERQMQVVLITDLPENLLDLQPRRFWDYWVSDHLFSLQSQS
jgi:hypothetical protein